SAHCSSDRSDGYPPPAPLTVSSTKASAAGHGRSQTRFEGYPEEREGADGWGTTVEAAAVIELLDLITAGDVTAEQVRSTLAGASAAVVEKCDIYEFDEHGAFLGYREGKRPPWLASERPFLPSESIPHQRAIGHTYLVSAEAPPW
ncbi:hypothetical protein P3T39_007629, partial [Kitasatospora sp. GP82]|nr:hypothetical protein [Kitasatospora sp. GP82]